MSYSRPVEQARTVHFWSVELVAIQRHSLKEVGFAVFAKATSLVIFQESGACVAPRLRSFRTAKIFILDVQLKAFHAS